MKKFNIFIYITILINTICIFLEESNITNNFITCIDNICIYIFIFEMLYKLKIEGIKNYFKDSWNIFDFIIILVSIPSLIGLPNLSILLSFRLLRLIRFMKIIKLFDKDDLKKVYNGTKLALRRTSSVFIGLFVLILIFSLISCNLFSDIAPNIFGTPLQSIYTTFQLFTIEGWTNIPDNLSQLNGIQYVLSIIYFISIVFICGILGMSLINSVFVDAMVEDNNDDIKKELEEIKLLLNKLSIK